MNGLGEALDRFNSRAGEPSQREPSDAGKKPKGKSTTKGHHYEVHAHSDGSHHLMVHKGGQLIHHSEHGSMEEAADAMKQHATGEAGAEEAEDNEMPGGGI